VRAVLPLAAAARSAAAGAQPAQQHTEQRSAIAGSEPI
jgi:hypothetical protein